MHILRNTVASAYRVTFFAVWVACSVMMLAAMGSATEGANLSVQKSRADAGNDPEQIVGQVVARELRAQGEDHSLWCYQQTRQSGTDHLTSDFVETPEGAMQRLVARNGHPVAGDELNKETTRINKDVRDPSALRQEAMKEEQDAQESRRLLKMLPAAFHTSAVAQYKHC